MESALSEMLSIAPELALALFVVYVVLRRDDMWRSCFKEVADKSDATYREVATQSDASNERIAGEYKQLAERLEKVLIANTEALARMCAITEVRQGLTEEMVREFRAVIAESRS